MPPYFFTFVTKFSGTPEVVTRVQNFGLVKMKRTHHDEDDKPHKKKCTQEEKDWKDLLIKYTVRDILAKRKNDLITINKDASLGDAMHARICFTTSSNLVAS